MARVPRRTPPVRRGRVDAKPPPTTFSVVLLGAGATKLAIVKIIKDVTGLGLAEAKDLVDRAPSVVRDGLDRTSAEELAKLLADAGAQVQITPPTEDPKPKPAPEQPAVTYTLTLLTAGPTRLAIVKIIKDVTGLGLAEAKALVDRAPSVVRDGLDRTSAEELAKLLADAGAQVQITPPADQPKPKPKPVPEQPAVTYTLTLLTAGPTKLAIVKIIKDVTGLGLKEAKDLVDRAPSVIRDGLDRASAEELAKLLADAGAQVQITPPTEEPKPAPEQPGVTYTLTLLAAGPTRLAIVKIIKDTTGLGLKEAKDLVDRAPSVIRDGLDRTSAGELAKLLADAGAQVEITP